MIVALRSRTVGRLLGAGCLELAAVEGPPSLAATSGGAAAPP